jgi:hypothetical protein
MGQGRVCTSKTKAFSFTHRTKVFADGTVQIRASEMASDALCEVVGNLEVESFDLYSVM